MDQEDVFSRAFSKSDDGSWTCKEAATLCTPADRIQITTGSRFYPGSTFMGFDLAEWLEARVGPIAQGD